MAGVREVLFPYRMLEEETSSKSNPTDAVLFFGLSLVLGIACRHLLRGTRVPYTVALLVLGIALGSIGISCFFISYM
jgi:CHASE2 domain-containing sensor protein